MSLRTIRLVPYLSIGSVPFGADRATIILANGEPLRESRNQLNCAEMHFEDITFRLSADRNTLAEATVGAEYFSIENLGEVAFVELGYTVAKADPETFQSHGFIVSPKFGLAFDPHFAPYLTVFSQEQLEVWNNFRPKLS